MTHGQLPGCSVLPALSQPTTPHAKGKPKAPKSSGERFVTINQFVDFTLSTLSGNEVRVWLILWRDTKDGTARTAHADIARRAGIGRRTAVRIVAKLESVGLLQTIHRGGLNRGMNVYRVLPFAKPP